MKKSLFIALMLPLMLTSCSSSLGEMKESNQNYMYYSEFIDFYDIPVGAGKGLEMYAWEKDSLWYAGLLPGTNRLKTIDEIITLQQKACPIEILKEIFSSYPEYDRYWCSMFIVSNPPQEHELNHVVNKQDPDYIYLCNYFDIKI